MRPFEQLVEFDVPAVSAGIGLLAVDDGNYVLEIEGGETSEGWACGDVGDDGREDRMFMNYEGEGSVDCLFQGSNRRERLEDIVARYADVVVDLKVVPNCEGLFKAT